MKRGVWHQFGDRSQKLAEEQLQAGVGVGVIISPRDLGHEKAVEYAKKYKHLGASIVIDQQFYVPEADVGKLASYDLSIFRKSVTALQKLSTLQQDKFREALYRISKEVGVDAIIAPATFYAPGHPENADLNSMFFELAKSVANKLNVPLYGSVVINCSQSPGAEFIGESVAHATSLSADGWYYAYEFPAERIPSAFGDVYSCIDAGLTLAATGKPVLHAFAGPMGILSFAFGAQSIGLGHSQNLWKFDRRRWAPPEGGGGGGDAPARHFSTALWGTIIDPDEMVRLPSDLKSKVFTKSPFTTPWDRWGANKHFVNVVGSFLSKLATETNVIKCGKAAISKLGSACQLHKEINGKGIQLQDDTNKYQANWRQAIERLHIKRADDFELLGWV